MIDYIMQNLWQMWAVVAVICLILELTAGDFFIFCFAIGAVGAAIDAGLLGNGIYAQLFVFVVITLLSLFYVRPFAKRYLHKGEDKRISNADALLGRQGRVVETIVAGGDIWKAVTQGDADIPEGSNVTVIDRESTIITVKL